MAQTEVQFWHAFTGRLGDLVKAQVEEFNSSTPVLWVNRDAMEAAGADTDNDLSTSEKVGDVLDQLKEGGEECPLVSAWQSWIHLENMSVNHDVPSASKDNGFTGLDTELILNGLVQAAQLNAMGDWAKDGKPSARAAGDRLCCVFLFSSSAANMAVAVHS